jgi:hypothetical protein
LLWVVQSDNIIAGKNLHNQFTDKKLYADNSVRKYFAGKNLNSWPFIKNSVSIYLPPTHQCIGGKT